ncbi:Hypothetical protein R9X50_00106300 [Acrodontium crateriforme]|uniref:RGS domain-containing protein n=1 Tax=Acrodontium crateriforme TaxID=150365 RepID=A0AAQ3R7J9_9PEZI|nr:Hypothetical protein R9X50_00106300 [Acrodontium crateriforme]
MIVRKRSDITSSSSTCSSRRSSYIHPASALTEAWDADDEAAMSADDHVPSRPMSVILPRTQGISGPYCARRPTLKEILANTSVAPWTLAAFMAYLSNNHCLETLEFTMDAGRYRKHYQKMMARAGSNGTPPSKDREYVQALWQRLVDAYIRPSGSREVNLPSQVRDPILHVQPATLPPAPETLDAAVTKIYELMEESVLVPFLNSASPGYFSHATVSSCPSDTSEEAIHLSSGRSMDTQQKRQSRYSPPQSAVEPHPHSFADGTAHHRKSAPSNLTTSFSRSRQSVKLSPTTSTPAASISTLSGVELRASTDMMTSGTPVNEDGGSTDGHAYESHSTPPTSPPMSDASPKRDSGMWKKLGRLSGMKSVKKKSQSGFKEEQ